MRKHIYLTVTQDDIDKYRYYGHTEILRQLSDREIDFRGIQYVEYSDNAFRAAVSNNLKVGQRVRVYIKPLEQV